MNRLERVGRAPLTLTRVNAVGSGKTMEQIIKRPVFLNDDNDMFDWRRSAGISTEVRPLRCRWLTKRSVAAGDQQSDRQCQAFFHYPQRPPFSWQMAAY